MLIALTRHQEGRSPSVKGLLWQHIAGTTFYPSWGGLGGHGRTDSAQLRPPQDSCQDFFFLYSLFLNTHRQNINGILACATLVLILLFFFFISQTYSLCIWVWCRIHSQHSLQDLSQSQPCVSPRRMSIYLGFVLTAV